MAVSLLVAALLFQSAIFAAVITNAKFRVLSVSELRRQEDVAVSRDADMTTPVPELMQSTTSNSK